MSELITVRHMLRAMTEEERIAFVRQVMPSLSLSDVKRLIALVLA